jgi:hypothetical protein
VRRVHNLEMELSGVEPALLVGDHGDGRVRRGADHAEARGQSRHAVAVTHPHRIALALAPHALEQGRVLGHRHLGAAELAVMPALDRAAELLRHRLLAVADAEDRHARRIDFRRRKRRVMIEHRGRSAGEDHALGPHPPERLVRSLKRHDFAVDFLFAHPPGDELRDLGAQIDNENLVVLGEPPGGSLGRMGRIEERHLEVCAGRARCGQGRQSARR